MPGAAPAASSRLAACAAAPIIALALGGCSTSDDGAAPVECRSPPEAVLRALAEAPDPVVLGGTPISDCLTSGSDSADLQTVGIAITETATRLSAEARARPEGDAALELGYLVAAVRAGASETQGIHDELVRRLEQELHGVDTSSEAFTTGERAGRDSG